ncbi:hypothetical protein RQM59_03770 [Flavobacteriaceae bacterium S356]|uniref:Lipoprotein n=1 Tax=Asprobacillus argus TaxID=3076534 RepID=A0ABU3LD06_9FLAO|nr:hypothetical protein [Flavobacteriaceae bacterium S356]
MKKYIITMIVGVLFASCVQETHTKKVTFFIDMNGVENVNSVGIRGNFLPNKWRETVPMSDEDKDGIYQISFTEKTAAYGIAFKFVKNNNQFELPGEGNRELVFKYQPEVIEYKAIFNNNKHIKIDRK